MTTDKKAGGNKPPTKTSKPSKPSKPIKETKESYFLRVATPRVSRVLSGLRILGNCSNRNNYSYTTEQIDKMFNRITENLEKTKAKFIQSKEELESFEF